MELPRPLPRVPGSRFRAKRDLVFSMRGPVQMDPPFRISHRLVALQDTCPAPDVRCFAHNQAGEVGCIGGTAK